MAQGDKYIKPSNSFLTREQILRSLVRQDENGKPFLRKSSTSGPLITLSVPSLSFPDTPVGEQSASQTYTPSGTNLTGDITVTPETGFLISLTDSDFASDPLEVSPDTPIYVVFAPLAEQEYSAVISHTSPGAATKNLGVSGLAVDSVSAGLSWYYKLNGNSQRSYGTNNGGDANISYVSGLTGLAAQLSGNGFIMIDPSDDFNLGTGEWTINAWINPSVSDSRQILFAQANWQSTNTSVSFLFELTDANKVRVLIKVTNDANTFTICTSTSDIPTDEDTFISLKRVGNFCYLKINNSLEDTKAINNYVNPSKYKVGIGCAGEYRDALLYNGKIELFAGWKRALSDDEETYLYNNGEGLAFVAPTPSVSLNTFSNNFIDVNTIAFSTFQCHSQHIVVTSYGIFACYWKTYTETPKNQTWKFVKSTDDGNTWTVLISGTSYIEPPCIEHDSNGNIYLFNNDSSTTTKVYKINNTDFTTLNQIANITGLNAHKHSSMLDEANNRLYYMCRNVMTILQLDGTVLDQSTILQAGTTGGEEYPFFILNPDGSGELVLGWVTAVPNSNGNYKTINFMMTRDLGETWELPDGTPITTPAVSDEGGPTQMITLVGEIATNKFINGFTWANERLHFKYWLDDSGVIERYLRINPTTGVVEISTNGVFSGGNVSIFDLADGAFVRTQEDGTATSPSPIYAFGGIYPNLVSIVSNDNGDTWENKITVDGNLEGRRYSVGTHRETYSGKCYGVYTGVTTKTPPLYTAPFSGWTYFFKRNA